MIVRRSILDNSTTVIEIEDGDEGPAVEMLSTRGHGYAIFGEDVPLSMAIIDGRIRGQDWATDDHVLAVEAHELGHIIEQSNDEPTAELKGIELLESAGFFESAKLLKNRGII
jgi:hypothetical protein|tara:strand:- start:274 stop:612 length:339 start_codon:yes stop_codon:yes gene_type:complete